MADEKTPTTEVNDEEDGELGSISASLAFDETAYRKMLAEQGVPEATIEVLVAPIKAQAAANAKLFARDQRRALTDYRGKLIDEFKLPPTTPLTGVSKAEMRKSAQQFRAFADSIAPAATATTAASTAAAADAREAQWVQPPAGATEVVAERATATYGDMNYRARTAKPSELDAIKKATFADLKAGGAVPINRPSMSSIVARKAQAAKA